jgi:membrane protease YdiL (CAAX protease family)
MLAFSVRIFKERDLILTTSVLTTDKSSLKSQVEKHQVTILILLVYGLTWPFMILEVLASQHIVSFTPPAAFMILQGFMPGVAAVIVTGLTRGSPGVRALLQKVLIVRVSPWWYAFAFFTMAGVSIAAILLTNRLDASSAIPLLSPENPFSGPLGLLAGILMLFLFTMLFNAEEFAWRGVALPRLQARHNALVASLILSVPWLFFHLPLFFKAGSSQSESSFLSYAVGMVATTILFTFLYNHTRGSLLLVYILHASMNTWTQIFSINSSAPNPLLDWTLTAVLVALAVLVVIVTGAKNLARTNARIIE